jgi:glycine hydroxymethyltransferase
LESTSAAIIKTGKDAGKPSQSKVEIVPEKLKQAQDRVAALLSRFPVYPTIDVEYLRARFVAA